MGAATQYGKIKVGVKTLDDAVMNLGSLKKGNRSYSDKGSVMKALSDKNIATLREISNYFYQTNGLYEKACNTIATMYRYDWYLVPEIFDESYPEEKILKEFYNLLHYLDNSYIKKICADIALKVVVEGAYYGYMVDNGTSMGLQELPIGYCRSRYSVGNLPAVEFDMRFFDQQFPDVNYRMRVLKLFPAEFAKGYALYKQGKLQPDFQGDTAGSWYLLDPNSTVKFSFNNIKGDVPYFMNSIPAIIDLDAAQDLDRRKQMQKLLKIVVQKLPMDKNGDLVFDIDEARDIHNNAVEMLRRAVGVDVLTTFTDVDSIDMSDRNTATSTDDLEKVERTVFNSMGISQNLFNTNGNLSLEKSILNDEGAIRTLLLQFAIFFDRVTHAKSPGKKKYCFRLYMLETTQYNYKEMSKLYKEQVQIGYSKMLPQIALGHSQSSILNTIIFENDILHLSTIMIPPVMSSTMSGDDLRSIQAEAASAAAVAKGEKAPKEKSTGGRPELPDDQKSEKTIQNKESMS